MRRLNSVLACVIAGVWALTIGAGIGQTQIIAQHSGASDPTTESWTYLKSGPTTPIIGPVTNDQNSGVDAWSVALSSTSTNVTEAVYLGGSPTNVNAALTNGWELTANLRFPVLPQNSFFFINLNLSPLIGSLTPTGYALIFSPGQGGLTYELSSSIIGGMIHGTAPPALLSDPTDYHLFQIQYDPVSKSADLFIDGSQKISNFVGTVGDNSPIVEWTMSTSSTATPNVCQVNVNYLQLAVVPEPSTLTLLALGVVGLLFVLRRR